MICGRSSWAVKVTLDNATQASSATKNHPQYKILSNVIFANRVALTFAFDSRGEIPMNVNDKAPDFTLQDENEKELSLNDLRGKTVVLYFFPRADTPG